MRRSGWSRSFVHLLLGLIGSALPLTADVSFGPPISLRLDAGGSQPRAMAFGDVDRDGRADVVTASYASDSVTLFLGTGGGALRLSRSFPVGNGPIGVELLDVDADGRLDIVSANEWSEDLSVLLGDGAGGFTSAWRSPLALRGRPVVLRSQDLNDDGYQDLVVGLESGLIAVLLGSRFGFLATFELRLASPASLVDVAIGDLDGDGRLDILALSSGALVAFRGSGDGGFREPPRAVLAMSPRKRWLTLGDINDDGELDIVAAEPEWTSVYLGVGRGELVPAPLPGDGQPGVPVGGPVTLGDVNGDGKLDLLGWRPSDWDLYTLGVGLGDARGGFGRDTLNLGVHGFVTASAAFDLSGDGIPDLICTTYENDHNAGMLEVFVGGTGLSVFAAPIGRAVPTTAFPSSLAVAPLSPGAPPAVVTVDAFGTLRVFMAGKHGFAEAEGSPFDAPRCDSLPVNKKVTLVDLNGDGQTDMALTGNGGAFFYLGDGSGRFSLTPRVLQCLPLIVDIGFADFDRDGILDFVAAPSGLPLTLFPGKGDGTFLGPIEILPGDRFLVILVADLNRDANPDLIVAEQWSGYRVLLGDGNGSFLEGPLLPLLYSSPAIGDVDGDGIPDIVTLSVGMAIETNLGDGRGGFGPGLATAAGSRPYWPYGSTPVLVDIDGDGRLDVIALPVTRSWYLEPDPVPIWLGDGAGRFRRAGSRPFALDPLPLLFTDLTGDGRPDAVALDRVHGAVVIYPQLATK